MKSTVKDQNWTFYTSNTRWWCVVCPTCPSFVLVLHQRFIRFCFLLPWSLSFSFLSIIFSTHPPSVLLVPGLTHSSLFAALVPSLSLSVSHLAFSSSIWIKCSWSVPHLPPFPCSVPCLCPFVCPSCPCSVALVLHLPLLSIVCLLHVCPFGCLWSVLHVPGLCLSSLVCLSCPRSVRGLSLLSLTARLLIRDRTSQIMWNWNRIRSDELKKKCRLSLTFLHQFLCSGGVFF